MGQILGKKLQISRTTFGLLLKLSLLTPVGRLVTELGCEAETRMCILVFFLTSYGLGCEPWPLAHGLWPMGHGPRALAHGPWPIRPGPWALAHGRWPMGPGPWAPAHGPWPMGPGPWALAHGLWLMGPGQWAPAHGPKIDK